MAATKKQVPSALLRDTLDIPKWVDSLSLAANTAESYTVPADIGYLIITGTNGFYLDVNGTAAVPGDVTDGTAAFYVPSAAEFVVSVGEVISVISTSATVVTFAGYRP